MDSGTCRAPPPPSQRNTGHTTTTIASSQRDVSSSRALGHATTGGRALDDVGVDDGGDSDSGDDRTTRDDLDLSKAGAAETDGAPPPRWRARKEAALPGLWLVDEFISPEEEAALLRFLDSAGGGAAGGSGGGATGGVGGGVTVAVGAAATGAAAAGAIEAAIAAATVGADTAGTTTSEEGDAPASTSEDGVDPAGPWRPGQQNGRHFKKMWGVRTDLRARSLTPPLVAMPPPLAALAARMRAVGAAAAIAPLARFRPNEVKHPR
jgi:hypothetical protein